MREDEDAGSDEAPGAVPGYTVAVKRSALKELKRLPAKVATRVSAAIASLADDPRPAGCKKLKRYDDLWRIRSGDYRVIYSIADEVRVVEVRRVADRKDAYRA